MCDWHYQGSNFLYIYIYIYMWCGEMVYDYRWNKVGMIITPARIILATMQVKKKKKTTLWMVYPEWVDQYHSES